MEIPEFRMPFSTKSKVERSSFENKSLTFGAAYYRKGKFIYEYTPRTADAHSFMEYRREAVLEKKLGESRARALAKEQKDKRGGLLSINIPIKSKAMESLFGEGGAGLKVSGYHQISFSGRSQWDDRASTATYRQNKFPSLNMEQVSRFDINGTIGTKISVSVSQDSKTDIPLANRLMIRYRGDEDDIIKTIEAGNTTLSLPNTRFVGYATRIQGLFGIKSEAQIGGLKLTAIASQEKGTTEKTTISAGASASRQYIRDWEYYDGKIFDLGRPEDFDDGDVIEQIYVYQYVGTHTGAGIGDTAWMYVNPDPSVPDSFPRETSESIVKEVEQSEYWVDKDEYWILFNRPIPYTSNVDVGVYMVIRKADGSSETIGDISNKPYKLKLIRNKNPDSSMVTWDYVWRNVYSLRTYGIGGGKLELEGLEINAYKGLKGTEQTGDNLDHQNGVPYIRILGLDRFDQKGSSIPDGLVDINTPIIEPEHGLLIFPDRKPFNPSQQFDSAALDPTIPEIYVHSRGEVQVQNASQYYIEISSRSRASDIALGKPNIIEGSERITLNGRQLVRGQDYNINYDFGRVTFLTDEAVDPNADITIDFEYSPFIMTQKKTLFGIRGVYEASRNLKVGATFLYKSDKATERKPKVGQETTKMVVWDVDASFKLKPNFLTNLANALPFYTTESGSNLAVSAEIAQSYPNPNVDGVAYLDDFEGSRDSYSLGVYREIWHLSSKPMGLDSTRIRAKLIWYNPYYQIPTRQIWDREVAVGESGSHTLWLKFNPGEIDRRAGGVDSTTTEINDSTSWAGVMRYLPRGAANQDRAQLLELRLNGYSGVLHINLGNISEDINGNDTLNTEDTWNFDILDEGEDVGLDGMTDDEERIHFGETGADPSGDNWYYDPDVNPNDYDRLNGTQGNERDPGTIGRPDTEDIDRDRILNRKNDYFSFRVDLSDPASEFYVEGSENEYKWRTIRIPIRDTSAIDRIEGEPSWSQISYIRIWIDSTGGKSTLLGIASVDIISSNWEDTLILPEGMVIDPYADPDEIPRFNVAVINTQENAGYYDPPPGVTGHYDRTNQITEPEQSLLLHFHNFAVYDSASADTGIAERILIDTPSLMGYRRLKMFVHAPPDSVADSLLFFFRIGRDNQNYYEFREILNSGGWIGNDVDIDFDKITGLKEYLDIARKENPDTNEIVDGNYRVFGQPNITKVKYLACGVVNLNPADTVTGDVWVDELQLIDVRRDVGMAARMSVSGNVADLFTYNAGYSYQNSYFRKISASTRGGAQNNLGSGKSSTSYNFGISFKLDKFLPRSYGAGIPISFRYSKNTSVPRLRFNSDIILPEELRDKESTVNTSKSFSVSESFNKKTKNPLFTILLNRLRTNFSYNRSDGRSPSTPKSFSENYRVGTSYSYTAKQVPNIKPFFWTRPIPILKKLSDNHFFFFPNSITLSGDLNRNLRVSENSSGVLTDNLRRDFRGNMKTSYKISDNLNANFSMDTKRDLSDPSTVKFSFDPKKFKLGRETNYSQSFGASYSPALYAFLTHKFTFSTSYREGFNVTNGTRNISASKSYSVSGNLDLKKLFGKPSSDRSRQFRPDKKGEMKPRGKNAVQRILEPPAKVMRFLTGWVQPISYDFKESYNYSYLGLLERAQLKFRFGLTEDIGAAVDPESRATGRSNSSSKATNYSFRSGTMLLGGLKTDVSFSRTIRRDIVKSVNPQKSVATTFPDINFSIRQLSTIKFLNPIIKRFSPRTKYSRSKSETHNLTTSHKTSEKTTVSQSPLLAFSFGLLKGMQINFKTDKSVTENKSFNSATGALTRISRNTSKNTSISTKYSFTWPTGIKIPLFGRLKFRSTMSMSVDVSMRKQKTEQSTGSGPILSQGERSDFMVTPTISYSFSSQIKGGLTARWQDTNDMQTRRKSHVRELRIWVDIRF